MHGIALRHIITPLTSNRPKIALFRECLSGVRCLMKKNAAAWRSCSVPIHNPCSFGCPCWVFLLCRSDCGSMPWCSFTLFFVYYRNYIVLQRITYTLFYLSFVFSLFRSIFFIINLCITPNYTVLHSITSYIALSIPKLYISLFWYLKYWKCRSCINFISK